MYSTLILLVLSNLFYFILHVANSGSFPKTLTSAEEKKYLDLYKLGDEDAKSKLIQHNLRLVAHIINIC